ncbi:EVE domain-containing protein [Desulforamulus aquiferis]|uniref:EVE domain-containing protein n=1 Tax=Desulforamulus aquiferis TaxID=1397668 RepID=A0AAW7ZB03_9FIRM|nr:EVE domain-containing protein [Desulforamulus aquiferis]MDO7786680.1 EVE domain-containing protein [Desulforamulus aquiferis]RYD06932.1 hypothetical protein N752_02030 [Desulforamulus aquiferis]
MQHWLLKTEPASYSYTKLEMLGRDTWEGVRNFAALKHLRQMKPGDLAFIYHTGKEKAVVGVAEIVSDPYPDPGEQDARLIIVDVIPRYPINRPVTLREIKENPLFQEWLLVHRPRLSVMPVSEDHWKLIHKLGETSLL